MNADTNFKELALHDELTGLKNRRGLVEDCSDKQLGDIHFIYIDLDNFKKINHILGYEAGDYILKDISKKLIEFCGKSEVYRIGGDKFILLTENHFLCEPSTLEELFKYPYKHNDIQFMINARIAVLDFDEFSDSTVRDVLMLFDFAISEAKSNKRRGVTEVHKEMQEQFLKKKEIEKHIFDGVQRDKFFAMFQPFVDTFTNEVVGFETASRWNFYDKILVPKDFLPIATYTGLIFEIECKMFRETCIFLKELKESGKVKIDSGFKAAVKFTKQTLARVKAEDLNKVLKENNLRASEIIIEINENFLEEECANDKIKELRKLGFYIVLDEYSSNSSSLYYLPEAGINAIKLDHYTLSRVDSNQEYKRMRSVLKLVVDLAKGIDVVVISDGVNNSKHVDLLKNLGVNIGMGSHYAKAISKEAFIEFASTKRKGNR